MKSYTKYICQQCSYESVQWLGKCPNCGSWGSLVETLVPGRGQRIKGEEKRGEVNPVLLSAVKSESFRRISTKIQEFDRVLGGGIVPGSVTLLAGDPGVGKSTLMLQVAANISSEGLVVGSESGSEEEGSVLYVSGEESAEQIKIRAERLGIKNKDLLFLNETNVDEVLGVIEEWVVSSGSGYGNEGEAVQRRPIPTTHSRPKTQNSSPLLVVIDSIQTLYTASLSGTPGSVGQVRECTSKLLNFAKKKGIPLFIIGHVTKEGAIAGPMVLAHLVDTVLFFEGEKFQSLRLLRSFKNRFGPTDEIGVFEMKEKGLFEVSNPSALFLEEKKEKVAGSVTTCLMEGSRPLLCEIQALVVPTQLAVPRRVSQGIDWSRLQLLVAVLTKRASLPLSSFDIFVNVVGGIKVEEPAADLAVCLAIVSSYMDKPLKSRTCALGEIGLLGEIRAVGNLQKRVKEAQRLGFRNIVSFQEAENIRSAIKISIS